MLSPWLPVCGPLRQSESEVTSGLYPLSIFFYRDPSLLKFVSLLFLMNFGIWRFIFIYIIDFLVIYGRCVYILMLDNFDLDYCRVVIYIIFVNLNYHFDILQWWLYQSDQLQIVHVFGFPIGICLETAFQFVFILIFGYVCSLFL